MTHTPITARLPRHAAALARAGVLGRSQSVALLAALTLALLAAGCQSLHLPGITKPLSSSRGMKPLPGESIGGVRGPLQRTLQTRGHDRDARAGDDGIDEQRLRDLYAEGESLYKAGEFKAAEKKFELVTKDGLTLPERIGRFRIDKVFQTDEDENDWRQYRGSRVKEDAWFMIAESQYARKRYASAQDSYTKLVKDFPSTRHMDAATRRLFEIAQRWLGTPDFATTDEIYMADHEESGEAADKSPNSQPKPPGSMILVPNLTDRTRPVFDTPGRAVQSLKTIWMNDPTGPLADDALMLTATYYLRKGDYLEADHFFTILREEFPKSPHLQEAFVLGSHVKLMSYEGPLYDSRSLDEAIELKKRALVNFPDLPDAERLRSELPRLTDAKAEELWRTAQYYQRRNNPRAVRIYCKQLLKEFPKCSFAAEAEDLLSEAELRLAKLGPDSPGSKLPGRSLEDEKAALRKLIPPVTLPKMPAWFDSRGDEKPLTPEDNNADDETPQSPGDEPYDQDRRPRAIDLTSERGSNFRDTTDE